MDAVWRIEEELNQSRRGTEIHIPAQHLFLVSQSPATSRGKEEHLGTKRLNLGSWDLGKVLVLIYAFILG